MFKHKEYYFQTEIRAKVKAFKWTVIVTEDEISFIDTDIFRCRLPPFNFFVKNDDSICYQIIGSTKIYELKNKYEKNFLFDYEGVFVGVVKGYYIFEGDNNVIRFVSDTKDVGFKFSYIHKMAIFLDVFYVFEYDKVFVFNFPKLLVYEFKSLYEVSVGLRIRKFIIKADSIQEVLLEENCNILEKVAIKKNLNEHEIKTNMEKNEAVQESPKPTYFDKNTKFIAKSIPSEKSQSNISICKDNKEVNEQISIKQQTFLNKDVSFLDFTLDSSLCTPLEENLKKKVNKNVAILSQNSPSESENDSQSRGLSLISLEETGKVYEKPPAFCYNAKNHRNKGNFGEETFLHEKGIPSKFIKRDNAFEASNELSFVSYSFNQAGSFKEGVAASFILSSLSDGNLSINSDLENTSFIDKKTSVYGNHYEYFPKNNNYDLNTILNSEGFQYETNGRQFSTLECFKNNNYNLNTILNTKGFQYKTNGSQISTLECLNNNNFKFGGAFDLESIFTDGFVLKIGHFSFYKEIFLDLFGESMNYFEKQFLSLLNDQEKIYFLKCYYKIPVFSKTLKSMIFSLRTRKKIYQFIWFLIETNTVKNQIQYVMDIFVNIESDCIYRKNVHSFLQLQNLCQKNSHLKHIEKNCKFKEKTCCSLNNSYKNPLSEISILNSVSDQDFPSDAKKQHNKFILGCFYIKNIANFYLKLFDLPPSFFSFPNSLFLHFHLKKTKKDLIFTSNKIYDYRSRISTSKAIIQRFRKINLSNQQIKPEDHTKDGIMDEVGNLLAYDEIGVFENENIDYEKKSEKSFCNRLSACVGNIYSDIPLKMNSIVLGSETLTFNVQKEGLTSIKPKSVYSRLLDLLYNCNSTIKYLQKKKCIQKHDNNLEIKIQDFVSSETPKKVLEKAIYPSRNLKVPIPGYKFNDMATFEPTAHLSGCILGLGFSGEITQDLFLKIPKSEDDLFNFCLYVAYGLSNQKTCDEVFLAHAYCKLKDNLNYMHRLGLLLGLSYVYRESHNISVLELLGKEISKRGSFECISNKGFKIWYDENYRIILSFGVCLVLRNEKNIPEISDPISKLIIDGFSLSMSNKKSKRHKIEKTKHHSLIEIFYSSLFCELLSFEKTENMILMEINHAILLSDAISKIQIQEIYSISGKLFYLIFLIIKNDESKSDFNIKIYMDLILFIEDKIFNNQHLQILLNTLLIFCSVFYYSTFEVSILRVLRRFIKKTQRINHLHTIEDFIIPFKEQKQFGERYGQILLYKICVGLVSASPKTYLKFNKALILNILATFYIRWPLSPDEALITFFLRYFLLDSIKLKNLSKLSDTKKNTHIVSKNAKTNYRVCHKPIFNETSDFETKNDILENGCGQQKNVKTELRFLNTEKNENTNENYINLQNHEEDTKNNYLSASKIDGLVFGINNVLFKSTSLDRFFLTQLSKLDCIQKKILMDFICEYDEKHGFGSDLKAHKILLSEHYKILKKQ